MARQSLRARLGRVAPAWWAVPALALLAYPLLGRGFVNTDAMWSLAWGRQLAHLDTPDFTLGATPHPLSNLVGVLLAPLGSAAEPALHALGYLAVGGVIFTTGLIAQRLFGWVAAVVAAGIVATRDTVQFFGALAYLDVLFAALVLWAAVLELRQPRRGTAVVVLLTVAGLLRPEAWLLTGAYILYARWGEPRRIVALAAFALLAPALWVLEDLLVTGKPFWSFTRTREVTPSTGRPSGLGGVLEGGPDAAAQSAYWSVLVTAAAGLAVAWWSSRARVLLWALAITLVASAVPVIAGTPLNERYFLPSLALVCVLAAAAVAVVLRPDAPRLLRVAGGLCVLLLVATSITQARDFHSRRSYLVELGASRSAARSLVVAGLPCSPLVVPNARMISPAAVWLETRPEAVRDGRRPVASGSYLWGTPAAMSGIAFLAGRPGAVGREPSAPVVATKRGWRLRARCGRAGASPA